MVIGTKSPYPGCDQEMQGNQCSPQQPQKCGRLLLTERIAKREQELMTQLDTLRKAKAVLLSVPNIDEVFELLTSLPF